MSVEHIPARGPMVDANRVVTSEWLAWFREVAALDTADDDDDDSESVRTVTIREVEATGIIPASRMPALIGDVTTAEGDVTTTIQPGVVTEGKLATNAVTTSKILDSAVTFAKIQNVATDVLLGRDTDGTGVIEQLSTIPEAVQDNITKLGHLAVHLIPAATDTYDIGRPDRLWSQGYLSQLNAILFAIETQTLFGGYATIGHDAGTLGADVSSVATTVDFGKTMTVGDFILIRAVDTAGNITSEYMQVGSNVAGTVYNVTRNLSGLGLKNWAQGVPFLVLGTTSDGRIDLLAYDGRPRILFVEQGATYNAQTMRGVIGNLNSYYGYVSDLYGAGFGSEANTNLVIDSVNGLRIRSGTTTYAQMAAGTFRLGLSGGNRVEWDGTDLTVEAETVNINNLGIAVTPNNASALAQRNGYKFEVSDNREFGMYAWENAGTSDRSLNLWARRDSGTVNMLLESRWNTFPNVRRAYINARGDTARVDIVSGDEGGVGISAEMILSVTQSGVAWGTTATVIADSDHVARRNAANTFASVNAFTLGLYERGRTPPVGEWTTYTPTITNFTTGNGSIAGRYARVGKTVHFDILITLGATSSVTGTLQATTPTAHRAAASSMSVAAVTVLDASAGAYYHGKAIIVGSPTFTLYTLASPATGMTNTTPIAAGFATSDQIYIYGTYEEA